MTSLTPLVRRVMILWVLLWVSAFLLKLGDIRLDQLFGLYPTELWQGSLTAVLGLGCYAFLHDPYGVIHLLFNCIIFYWTGPEVERFFPGKKFVKFLALVIAAGAVARLGLQFIFGGPFQHPAIGGSGIVSACLATLAALQPNLRVSLIFITVRILPLFLVLAGLDLLYLIATVFDQAGNTASEIHLAGALVGWTCAGGFQRFPLFPKWAAKRRVSREQAAFHHSQQQDAELDRILSKISKEGIGSLNPKEKRFLEERSMGKR